MAVGRFELAILTVAGRDITDRLISEPDIRRRPAAETSRPSVAFGTGSALADTGPSAVASVTLAYDWYWPLIGHKGHSVTSRYVSVRSRYVHSADTVQRSAAPTSMRQTRPNCAVPRRLEGGYRPSSLTGQGRSMSRTY